MEKTKRPVRKDKLIGDIYIIATFIGVAIASYNMYRSFYEYGKKYSQ